MAAMEAAQRLDHLNLVSPAALRDTSAADLAASKLTGYEAMRRIRDDAARFRRDYANWRRGGARGSTGEGLAKSRDRSDSNQFLTLAHNPHTERSTPTRVPLTLPTSRTLTRPSAPTATSQWRRDSARSPGHATSRGPRARARPTR